MTTSEIRDDLNALKDRRASVEAERADAEDAVREAREVLVRGDAADTGDVKAAQHELAALAATVEAMDEEIQLGRTALQETRAEEKREAAIEELVALAGQASEQRAGYYDERLRLVEDFQERLAAVAQSEDEWRATFETFIRLAEDLAPAVHEGMRPITDHQKQEARERERDALVSELEARGADLDAAVPRLFKDLLPGHVHYTIGEGSFTPADKSEWAFSRVYDALRNLPRQHDD